MMIDYKTILSTTDKKLTLLQWLKKVEAALKSGSATGIAVTKGEDGKVTISINFADGTSLSSVPFEVDALPKGYAVDASGNITLNDALHIDKAGNVEMGKNAVVDGTLTLNAPEDLVLKTGAILPAGITVDESGNININENTFYPDGAQDNTASINFFKLADYNGDPFELRSFSLSNLDEFAEVSGGVFYCSNINRYMFGRLETVDGTSYFHGVTICIEDGAADIKFYPDVSLKIDDKGIQGQDNGYSIFEVAFDDQVSHAKYQHTVTIKGSAGSETTQDAYLCFTAYSSESTPVDSYQDLQSLFGGCRIGIYGYCSYGGAMKTPVYLDLHGGTIDTDFVVLTDGSGATYQTKLSNIGGITLTDDVCITK